VTNDRLDTSTLDAPRSGDPKRSLLAQERSRATRRAIVRAALELWSERGYETGVDETTAEEIANRAGVAKGTFYFHFARKEDILRDTGRITAQAFYEDAVRAVDDEMPLDDLLDHVLARLARRVAKGPRSALRRILLAQGSDNRVGYDSKDQFGFETAFLLIFSHAQEIRELPDQLSARDLSLMASSLTMGAIRDWAFLDNLDLTASLKERAAVLVAGARTYEPPKGTTAE
jgi:AcrR family transcriptional regulator